MKNKLRMFAGIGAAGLSALAASAAAAQAEVAAPALSPVYVSATPTSQNTVNGWISIKITATDPSGYGVTGCVDPDWGDGTFGNQCIGRGGYSVSGTVRHHYAASCTGRTLRLKVQATGDGEPPRTSATYVTVHIVKSNYC